MKCPLIAVLALCWNSCSGPADSGANSTTSQDSKEVEQLLSRYYQDFSDRNWDKFRTYFWPGATITTAWQQPGDSIARVDVTTIDDFIAEAPNGPGSQPVFEEKMLNSKITTSGNLAEAWVDYEARFGTSDNLSQWRGEDIFTLMRHDGEWRIVSLVFEAE